MSTVSFCLLPYFGGGKIEAMIRLLATSPRRVLATALAAPEFVLGGYCE